MKINIEIQMKNIKTILKENRRNDKESSRE